MSAVLISGVPHLEAKFLTEERPDHLLGRLFDAYQARQLGEAEELCLRILAQKPRHFDATHLLGVIAGQTRRKALGERLRNEAVAVEPREAAEHGHLVKLLRRERGFSQAQSVYENAIRLNTGDAAAHNNLGLACLVEQNLPKALACFERAIALSPGFAFAHYGLGLALQSQGRDAEAASSYRRAIALAPRFIDALSKLGDLLHITGDRAEAMVCFRRASASPDSTPSRLTQVKLLLAEDKFAAAEDCLRQTIALDPESTEAHRVLGNVLKQLGQFAEAILCFERAIALDPHNTASYLNLVQVRKLSAEDRPLVAQLRALLDARGLTDRDRVNLHFALGKAFDDLGSYEDAVRHFDEGNRIVRRGCAFDRAKYAGMVDRTIAAFTPEFFARYGAAGSDCETPVFILGMMRSGTTLVEQIISSHSEVAAGGELPFWAERVAEFGRAGSSGIAASAARMTADEYRALLRDISPEARRITDKMPHNFLLIGVMHWLFPKARIVHCRRHPVDTCLSILFTLFDMRHDFAYDRSDLVAFYEQYARLMAHWRQVLPRERFLEIDYEDLVADRVAATRRLIAFCGLDWDESCLQPESNGRVIKTASAWQARQPVYASSIARWRHYEPWLGELRRLLHWTPHS